MEQFDIPILMLVFNRPELTQRVLNKVLEIHPLKIYVVADGPRENKAGEKTKSEETRALFEHLPKSIEVIKLFRTENLGCKKSVSGGISWFFENEEKGIILEDDCLPDLSFFPYSKELLSQYENESQVMHISGNNFQDGIKRGDASYYFSIWPHIWGWATWRRAWQGYSSTMENISDTEMNEVFKRNFESWKVQEVFRDKYDLLKIGKIDTWDYQWMFYIWKSNGVAILPNVNLVSNIGFGEDALHCKDTENEFSNLSTESILPILHPSKIEVNQDADIYSFKKFWQKNLLQVVFRKLRRFYLKTILHN